MTSTNGRLLVGLGSPHGDDRLGWHIAELVESHDLSGLTIRRATSPSALIDWLEGVERLAICDACQGSGRAGTAHCWQWPDEALAPVRFRGSHDMGLAAVLGLADALGLLPARVTIWTIEGMAIRPVSLQLDSDLSPAVLAAVPALVEQIENELR